MSLALCICARRPPRAGESSFCLLMHGTEPMRTTNTGWLVADVVPDTQAYVWSRTEPSPSLLALLADPLRQPYVVFPADGPEDPRAVRVPAQGVRRPLFVLLDGTWAEARKMFRTSRWLAPLPVLSLDGAGASGYRLRRSRRESGLCTAEVAALCMRLVGDDLGAAALEAWFATFVDATLRLRGQAAGPARPS